MRTKPRRVERTPIESEAAADPWVGFLRATLEAASATDGDGLPPLAPLPLELSRAAIERPLADLLARPSKGLRSRLAALGYALAGGEGDAPPALAAVVELLHAGSLVVDDIEDGSLTRRGGPTVHVQHGLPVALNAANYVYFVPFALLSGLGLPAERELALARRITGTLLRCHRGQALDVSVHVGRLARRDVGAVVHATSLLKTGALVELAVTLGGTLLGADAARLEALGRFGREVGVALQMLDDESSVRSPARREKGLEDARNARATWPWALVAEKANALAYAKLAADVRRVGDAAGLAEELVDALGAAIGDRGARRARATLEAAHARLVVDIGDHPLLARLARELDVLGSSYG